MWNMTFEKSLKMFPTEKTMTEREEINTYYDGVKEGLWKYAYWKDGIQYVGNMGTTLEEAVAKVEEEKKKMLKGAFE